MQHRYGRHGPRAWKRRRDRLYARSSVPVPVVPRVALVHVQLPAIDAERIIVIIMTQNPQSSTQITPLPNSSRELDATQNNGASQGQQDHQEAFNFVTYYAQMEARKKAQEDLRSGRQSSQSALHTHIESTWENHFAKPEIVEQVRRTKTDQFPSYSKAFLQRYKEVYGEEKELVGEDVLRIRSIISADKTTFGAGLSPLHIICLASLHAEQELPLSSEPLNPAYLEQVVSFVKLYDQEFKALQESQERL